MEERKYNVVFKGQIHEQATLSMVQERLASAFKVDVEKIKIMFLKKRTIVKKHASYELCKKVEERFLSSGAFVDIEEILLETPPPVQPSVEPEYSSDSEYPPESEYAPDSGHEYEGEYQAEPEYQTEPEYAPEPAQEYVQETEQPPAPEPEDDVSEIVEPEYEYESEFVEDSDSTEPVIQENLTSQPLSMEEDSDTDQVSGPETEPEPETELQFEEVEIESEIIQEDEIEDETEDEFEIVGVEPEFEPEFESDPAQDIDSEAEETSVLTALEMENPDVINRSPDENPYAAPLANLEQDDLGSESSFVSPQKLPAKNGINWLLGGLALFKRNPVTWILSIFLLFLIMGVASLIPILGSIATNIFYPVFLAGFMIGAKEQTEGNNFKISYIFSGFSNNTGQLILFGFVYLVAIFAIVGFAGIIIAVIAVSGVNFMNFTDPSALASMPPLLIILFVLVIMFITIPITMAYYFGPALISINQASIFHAVKMSFIGCLRNIVPFLLYSLAFLGVLIVIALIIGGLSFLIGMFLEKAAFFVGFAGAVIVMLTIAPITIASMYVAYKDIFYIK